jgi:hypothetical protein
MKKFANWFSKTFGVKAPDDLLNYLKDHPDGLAGESCLYSAEDIIDYTEERELQEKGLLYLGTGPMLNVFLLRAKDGKVFLVDKADFQIVDATFKSLETCITLLEMEKS